jgi:hypothetical protein
MTWPLVLAFIAGGMCGVVLMCAVMISNQGEEDENN